jgi:hypothetical protein
MGHVYKYSIADDLPGADDCVDLDKLKSEIEISSISTSLSCLGRGGDDLYVEFDAELSSADKEILDGSSGASENSPAAAGSVLGDHNGEAYGVREWYLASKMVNLPIAITETTNWQLIGGVCTDPSFFTGGVTNIVGRLFGAAKVDGTGLEVKVTEDNLTSEVDLLDSPLEIPDSSNEWATFKTITTVETRSSDNIYRLYARKGSATSAEIAFTSITMLELRG